MDNDSVVETWDADRHMALLEQSALIVLDTSDEYHLGIMRETLKKVKDVFTFDHHEPRPKPKLFGLIDPSASSTSEMAVEFADFAGISLDQYTAEAAYTGIVFDSGFFAYPKTTIRTFNAAIKTLEKGAQPNKVYRQLMENFTCASILLQKQALSNLEFHADKKIAAIIIRKEDLEISGAEYDDADGIVNIPLKAKEVEVSILIKEKPTGEVRCSLRSKGNVNVSKIAQWFGGGGHISAAGLKSSLSPEETLAKLLDYMEEHKAVK
jgi:phosphoesterase RecJ-like protein